MFQRAIEVVDVIVHSVPFRSLPTRLCVRRLDVARSANDPG
jgi:phospholipid N-methyltransferase